MDFIPGQRWYSLTEPELGLGLVEAVEGRQVVIAYAARAVVRRYGTEDPPLTRARLAVGQQVRGGDVAFHVEEIIEVDGLLEYCGAGQQLAEAALDAVLDVATPENRLYGGEVDDFRLFDLRYDALKIHHRMQASPARGFLGGRIRLFDHQLSIARDVCERNRVRVLLADEVGLGKTVEALLILHRLLLTERVENALILVPPALVHQWLAEAYLRFNLVFRVMGSDTHAGGTIDPESEDLPAALLDAQLFICPLGIDVGTAFIDAEWDIVIVDEAHHLEPGSAEFTLVEKLVTRTEHVIFLSATPDRDGEEGHFRRLALLDAARFHDFSAYQREALAYRELALTAERLQQGVPLEASDRHLLHQRLGVDDVETALAVDAEHRRQQLLAQLLDLHGIGRVMFRNVRSRIPGFPRRLAQPIVLDGGNLERLQREFFADIGQDKTFRLVGLENDPRIIWLVEFLTTQAPEKVLVLCASRAKVEAFAQALETAQRVVARFHEDMGAIERDRQAAWFLAADGPQVVVSSAIGAEGRNFQVAKHLVLLDLPLHADRLEQAIGRVDRIGQGEEVYIYPVVVAGTPQARLQRWYHMALQVFSFPWHGAPSIEREFAKALMEAVLAPDEIAMEQLIERAKKRNQEIINELENGRDRLLELTSFNKAAARHLYETIEQMETSDELELFMVDAFEQGGLDVERLGQRSYVVRAGMDYHRPFPGFNGDKMGVTFDRATALEHPERVLLTWDHPLVRDTLDTMLEQSTGNASVAQLDGHEPSLLLETLFVAEPTSARHLRADRFLPPTPIRIVINVHGEESSYDSNELRQQLQTVASTVLELPQVNALLPNLLDQARHLATEQAPQIAAAARQRMQQELEPAVMRLVALAKVNPAVSADEVEAARGELAVLDKELQDIRIRLDGIRLILVGAA